MLILRLVAILLGLGVAGSVAAYLLTGNRRYLGLAWSLLRIGVVAGALLVLLLFGERLLVAPF